MPLLGRDARWRFTITQSDIPTSPWSIGAWASKCPKTAKAAQLLRVRVRFNMVQLFGCPVMLLWTSLCAFFRCFQTGSNFNRHIMIWQNMDGWWDGTCHFCVAGTQQRQCGKGPFGQWAHLPGLAPHRPVVVRRPAMSHQSPGWLGFYEKHDMDWRFAKIGAVKFGMWAKVSVPFKLLTQWAWKLLCSFKNATTQRQHIRRRVWSDQISPRRSSPRTIANYSSAMLCHFALFPVLLPEGMDGLFISCI